MSKSFSLFKSLDEVYKNATQQLDRTWKCSFCNSTLLAVHKRRPVWDGPFPCSGGGECETVTTPYCPKCNEKPGK